MSLILPDEVALGNDKRYKSFVAKIEAILKRFESSAEWADLIGYLGEVKQVSLDVPRSATRKIRRSKKTF